MVRLQHFTPNVIIQSTEIEWTGSNLSLVMKSLQFDFTQSCMTPAAWCKPESCLAVRWNHSVATVHNIPPVLTTVFRGSALRLPSPSHPKNTDALISADAKLDRVKTMGTRGRINAIWWNIKVNPPKLVDMCGYELPTNVQISFTQNLTETKIRLKVLRGLLCFWIALCIRLRISLPLSV